MRTTLPHGASLNPLNNQILLCICVREIQIFTDDTSSVRVHTMCGCIHKSTRFVNTLKFRVSEMLPGLHDESTECALAQSASHVFL